MKLRAHKKALAVLLLTSFLFASLAAGCDWFSSGNKGWRCKSSKDCKGKLRCRQYYWPSKKKLVRLCAKRKDRLTNKSVYGWGHIYLVWAFVIGTPLVIAFLIVRDRMKQKKNPPPPPPESPA